MGAQAADAIDGERQAGDGGALLAVEHAGNDGVWVIHGQAANQGDGVLVGAHRGRPSWQGNADVTDQAAVPAQGQAHLVRFAVVRDDDLFEQGAQQFLAVAIGG